MSDKGLLAKSKLPAFKAWLEEHGYKVLRPTGPFEVLRWKGPVGVAMPIIFERHQGTVHFTCNRSAEPFVRRWIREAHDETS